MCSATGQLMMAMLRFGGMLMGPRAWTRALSVSYVFRVVAGFKLRHVVPVNGQSGEERLFLPCFQSGGDHRRETHLLSSSKWLIIFWWNGKFIS